MTGVQTCALPISRNTCTVPFTRCPSLEMPGHRAQSHAVPGYCRSSSARASRLEPAGLSTRPVPAGLSGRRWPEMLFPESPSQSSRHTEQRPCRATSCGPPPSPRRPGCTALRPPPTRPGPPSSQGLLGLPGWEAGSVTSGPTSTVAGSPAPRTGPGPQQAPNKRAPTVTSGPGQPQGSHTAGLLPGRPGDRPWRNGSLATLMGGM